MRVWRTILAVPLALAACAPAAEVRRPPLPEPGMIDIIANRLMAKHRVQGLALALVEDGAVRHVGAYGLRDVAARAPLGIDTVMYGASLTKFVFSTFVMQLAEEKRVDLDRPIGGYLARPLPEYEDYSDLAGDERWRELTLRILLSHRPGFANFRFFPPEGGYDEKGKLKFHFKPGTRYAYSGEGYYLAQHVLEEGLGIDVGAEMQRRIFDRLGMTRTAMTWRDDFAADAATGYTAAGEAKGHNRRRNARAAGSMDTSIADMARFVAAWQGGALLDDAARRRMLTPQLAIASPQQFPTLTDRVDPRNADVELAAGLGVVLWRGRRGAGFFKGGHDDQTDNMLVCLEEERRCLVLLANAARGDKLFPELVEALLGPTDLPWRWEYGEPAAP